MTIGQLSEFYVYRYLAAEGFLPGYNFTRLPLRVMLPGSDASVEFISRPRHIALREFGPNNVIYHKGQKFEITQLLGDPPGNRFENAVVSLKPGYFLRGEDGKRDRCPFSGEDLTSQANKEHLPFRELDQLSRNIQDMAFDGRSRNPLFFDFLYNRLRPDQELRMNEKAKEMADAALSKRAKWI